MGHLERKHILGPRFGAKIRTSAQFAVAALLAVTLVACGATIVATYENESGQRVATDTALSGMKTGPTRDALKAEWQDMSRSERDAICTTFDQASDENSLAALTEALSDAPELDPQQMYVGLQLLCRAFRT